jgi:hypothetical protein
MFRLSATKRRSLTVATVADDLSTLESVGRYLHERVSFRAVPTLEGAFETLAVSDVVVFYPDGFSLRAVQLFVRRLVGHATLPLVIVVTAEPDRFQPLSRSRRTADRFVVFAMPAWPWELFATIQASLPGPKRGDPGPC